MGSTPGHPTTSCLMVILALAAVAQEPKHEVPELRDMDSALCHAQRLAACRQFKNETLDDCGHLALNSSPKDLAWLSNCTKSIPYECPGKCSVFQNESVTGAAPYRPEVWVYNDVKSKQLHLNWSLTNASTTTEGYVYVLALVHPGDFNWVPMFEVFDEHEVRLDNDQGPCHASDLRVAAVSSSGTAGFSLPVPTLVLLPGPPRNITLNLEYQPTIFDNDTIKYTLQWQPDEGWSVEDLNFELAVDTDCSSRQLDQVYIFNDIIRYNKNTNGEYNYVVTGSIPTYAIGCTLLFQITLTQACNQACDGDTAEYQFHLSCEDVENYKGESCNQSPLVEPGPVTDVRVTSVQLSKTTLVMVSWLPPENLGSVGYVESYLVVWGAVSVAPAPSILEMLGQMDFVKVLGNTTVPGTELGLDIHVNRSDLLSITDVGLLIRALGPGQVLQDLAGLIYRDARGSASGHVPPRILLTDDGTILALQCIGECSYNIDSISRGSPTTTLSNEMPFEDQDAQYVGMETPPDGYASLISDPAYSSLSHSSRPAGNDSLGVENGVGTQNVTTTIQNESMEESRLVDVLLYWRRHKLTHNATTQGYRIQLVRNAGDCHVSRSTAAICDGQIFTTTSAHEFLLVFNLSSNTTYQLKVKPVDNLYISEDDADWNLVDTHTFTTKVLPVTNLATTSASALDHKSTTLPVTEQNYSNFKPTITFEKVSSLDQEDMNLIIIVVTCSVALLVILCVVGAALWVKRKRTLRVPALSYSNSPDNRDYSVYAPGKSLNSIRSCPAVSDEWELPVSCIKLGATLGSGAFGKVVQGRITRAMLTHRGVASLLADYGACLQEGDALHATVAVKMLQGDCEGVYRQDFLKEIQLMKKIGYHENIVSMLGCCTLRDPVCLVVEHVGQGDLLNYLKNVRHKLQTLPAGRRHYVNGIAEVIDPLDLLRFAGHIAKGMEFLASKGFVHRDLAARNVLVGSNNVCKIGDFGLARYVYDNAVYINRRGGRLPVKWMSVEAIFDMTFSTASDVWSFGVVLFEIVTLGGTPYPTIPAKNLLKELQSGYRMEKPGNCSQEL